MSNASSDEISTRRPAEPADGAAPELAALACRRLARFSVIVAICCLLAMAAPAASPAPAAASPLPSRVASRSHHFPGPWAPGYHWPGPFGSGPGSLGTATVGSAPVGAGPSEMA